MTNRLGAAVFPAAPGGGRPDLPSLRAAAFGEHPDLDVTGWTSSPVGRGEPMSTRDPADCDLADRVDATDRTDRTDRTDSAGWAAWSAAVVLGGQGRYAAASGMLHLLLRHSNPLLAAQAGVAMASHRRQLGGHALARSLDGAALRALAAVGPRRLAPIRPPAEFDGDGVDLASARADALLGLAADAVGLGRLGEARRLRALALGMEHSLSPEAVTPLVHSPTRSWRTLVRADWIAAEIALGSRKPEEAVSHAGSALQRAEAAGSTRHTIKSELIRSAGLATLATAQAIPRLRSVVEQATAFQQVPLVWPAALLLADLDPSGAAKWSKFARKALATALLQADPEILRCARASPWVPWSLLRSGDVERRGTRSKIFTD